MAKYGTLLVAEQIADYILSAPLSPDLWNTAWPRGPFCILDGLTSFSLRAENLWEEERREVYLDQISPDQLTIKRQESLGVSAVENESYKNPLQLTLDAAALLHTGYPSLHLIQKPIEFSKLLSEADITTIPIVKIRDHSHCTEPSRYVITCLWQHWAQERRGRWGFKRPSLFVAWNWEQKKKFRIWAWSTRLNYQLNAV